MHPQSGCPAGVNRHGRCIGGEMRPSCGTNTWATRWNSSRRFRSSVERSPMASARPAVTSRRCARHSHAMSSGPFRNIPRRGSVQGRHSGIQERRNWRAAPQNEPFTINLSIFNSPVIRVRYPYPASRYGSTQLKGVKASDRDRIASTRRNARGPNGTLHSCA